MNKFKGPLSTWDVSTTAEWIVSLGAGSVWETYKDICVENGLDGETLRGIEFSDLAELGFTRIHAKLVVRKLAEIEEA